MKIIHICSMYLAKQKKAILKESVIFILFVIATTYLTFSWYYSSDRTVFNSPTYDAFGIQIPGNYMIHGIDVSRYQDDVHWTSVKEMQVADVKLGFAFIKATEGTQLADVKFKRNWKETKEAGIARGAYHFFNPAKGGKAQADFYIKNVKLTKGDLPPVLDIETLTKNQNLKNLRKELKTWLKTVESHYKVKPIIYTNAGYYNKVLGKEFDNYPLWVAHYHTDQPRIDRKWEFWQHSDIGRVNGIAAAVDFNVFKGDSTAFNNLLLK